MVRIHPLARWPTEMPFFKKLIHRLIINNNDDVVIASHEFEQAKLVLASGLFIVVLLCELLGQNCANIPCLVMIPSRLCQQSALKEQSPPQTKQHAQINIT